MIRMPRSVELVWNDGVLDEDLEGDDLEGFLVRGFEHDSAGSAGLLHLEPARRADAPAVAGLEALEAELGPGCREIVAERFRRFEKGSIDDAADGVDAEVVRAGIATTITVEPGRRIRGPAATGGQRLAEDVAARRFDGFGGGHFSSCC